MCGLGSFDGDIYNGPAYHYTSPEGFIGILGGDQPSFRFTRSDCVNDISEGSYIIDVYKNVLDKLFAEKKIDQKFFNAIKNIRIVTTSLFKKDDCHYTIVPGDTYICCLSLDNDSLPMWNYYTKSDQYEGYNIGVDCNQLKDEIGSFYEVIYDLNEQERILTTLVLKVQNCIKEENKTYDQAKKTIEACITTWNLIFKSDYFKHEKEVRAIIEKPTEDNTLGHTYVVKYQTKNNLIIPYIEIPFNKESIFSVMIAPCTKDEIAKETTESFLKSKGIECDVHNSEIPIRF